MSELEATGGETTLLSPEPERPHCSHRNLRQLLGTEKSLQRQ
jgi:hypothetical protein